MAVTVAFAKRITRAWMRHAPRFWWGDRLDSRFLATEAVAQLRHQRILDVGCNAGVLLSEMDASNVCVGIDRSAEALRIARALSPSAGLAQADMFRLPFRAEAFDVVIFCNMLELPPHVQKGGALDETARVLRPGGRLYLTTPNRRYLRYRSGEPFVTYEELRDLLRPAFVSDIKGFNPLPPFPYGLPNGLLARVPGIWALLTALMERNVATRHACSFFVTAVKRPSASCGEAKLASRSLADEVAHG